MVNRTPAPTHVTDDLRAKLERLAYYVHDECYPAIGPPESRVTMLTVWADCMIDVLRDGLAVPLDPERLMESWHRLAAVLP